MQGGVLGGPVSLLTQATGFLGGIQPLHWFDFVANRAMFNSVDVGPVTSTPGWSFTRATVGTYINSAGVMTTFSSGQPRIGDRGILIEGGRTNLFLNSATGSTQSVTVAAVAHTLSFRGTGTITLTGTSTAGPLVGSGASTRVTLTFTPTAGSLTLTISGSCTNVQLEEGAFVSSWIPTAGTSVVRNAEVSSVSSPGVSFPLSLFVEFERASDSGAGSVFFDVNDNTNNERATLQVSGGDLPTATMVDGGAVQSNISIGSALAVGAVAKLSGRFATNDAQAARGGTLGTADTVATLPVTPTFIRFGEIASTGTPAYGYIRRAAIFSSALTDAQLQTVTA